MGFGVGTLFISSRTVPLGCACTLKDTPNLRPPLSCTSSLTCKVHSCTFLARIQCSERTAYVGTPMGFANVIKVTGFRNSRDSFFSCRNRLDENNLRDGKLIHHPPRRCDRSSPAASSMAVKETGRSTGTPGEWLTSLPDNCVFFFLFGGYLNIGRRGFFWSIYFRFLAPLLRRNQFQSIITTADLCDEWPHLFYLLKLKEGSEVEDMDDTASLVSIQRENDVKSLGTSPLSQISGHFIKETTPSILLAGASLEFGKCQGHENHIELGNYHQHFAGCSGVRELENTLFTQVCKNGPFVDGEEKEEGGRK